MSSALQTPMSYEAFLAWEDQQELRYEFDGITPHAMTGGTERHDDITFGVRRAFSLALTDKPCRVHGPNLKVRTTGDRVRYPDAFITCTPMRADTEVAREPVVVFEVVSPSTSGVDRIVKLREYQGIPSVQHYVMLEQNAVAAMMVSRQGGTWALTVLSAGDQLVLPEIGVEVALADCYAGVDLSGND